MKRIGYILLITILFLQAGGILIIYKVDQFFVRNEISAILNSENSQYQKLTLSIAEYQKAKINSYEISYKEKLYDVKKVIIAGDIAELQIIHDNLEEKILEKIKDFITQSNLPIKKLPDHLQQFLTLKFLPHENKINILIPTLTTGGFLSLNQKIISADTEIHTPPPELSIKHRIVA